MPMKGEGKIMKLLKIDNNHGFFLCEDGEYQLIDLITKEDLLRQVRLILTDDVEFDVYDENIIKNQAHQIIYKSIYSNLNSLKERKQEFLDESERLYLEDYTKYTKEITNSSGSVESSDA